MMKKLSMVVFIMALVAAFALPAFAYTVEGAKGERFTIGGAVAVDFAYRNTDKAANGVADLTKFYIGDTYNSHITATYTVGPASFTWVVYVNHDLGTYNAKTSATGTSYDAFIASDVWYGTYVFGNMVFSAGKQSGSTVSFGPSQRLGYTPSGGSHTAGITYGFVYDNKYPQIRLKHNISKAVAYQISLVQTGTYAETVGTATRQSYASFPMIAAKALLTFGPVVVNPALAYQQVNWNELPAGYETSMVSWLARVPVRATIGPFIGTFEVTYGQNLGGGSGSANICSSESAYGLYGRNAAGKILNANTLAGFIDLAMKFGPVTPHIYYGQTTNSNPDRYKIGDNSNTRSIVGINAYYNVTPNFQIIPEFFMSDFGVTPNTAAKTKLGTDWVGGVNFTFSF